MNTLHIPRAARALPLALALAGAAQAEPQSALSVVYCKATITRTMGNETVSVTLPPTDGYFDENGNPLTYWNVGEVPAGGVADSWHGDGGPGRFTAHNDGNVGAYFYVTTGGDDYYTFPWGNDGELIGQSTNVWGSVRSGLFGNHNETLRKPVLSPSELRTSSNGHAYHLAFTTDTTAKVPTWHSLDWRLYSYNRDPEGGPYYWAPEENVGSVMIQTAGYMGYVDAGDYLTFDLKFWAPPRNSEAEGNVLFTFCVEASSFPLWDHGRGVE